MPAIDRDYDLDRLRTEASRLLPLVSGCRSLGAARLRLYTLVNRLQFDVMSAFSGRESLRFVRARDCARALRGMLTERSDRLAGFSVAQALWDLARGLERPDLAPGFYAEMTHLARGLASWLDRQPPTASREPTMEGRDAAVARSLALDELWARAESAMHRYADGLSPEAVARRDRRRERVLAALGGNEDDWRNWRWHLAHTIRDPDLLARGTRLRDEELAAVHQAREARLPFGVTPYYASLLDDDPDAGRDRALRAQVLPPRAYVEEMIAHSDRRGVACDFMLERDTSPVDLVTRRYPAIAILKPFNTCPQICVYCQRNWEIREAMAPDALAPGPVIESACRWIAEHPAVREVLVTGGDPLAMEDEQIAAIMRRLADIRSVDVIRIGSRIPVTLPQRITARLAGILESVRVPGRREVCLVTHIEHAYEMTPETVAAVDRLRRSGIAVYNQLVYTYFVSRRFEAARLRMLLRRAGIDPYYTFAPKGKEETAPYRVPLARILQEQKEEARLLPGLRRTDEPVYNLPGLGKNYLRAVQHRDLISVLPDGSRVYEFHSWEKGVAEFDSHVGVDVPILDYLRGLAADGEDPAEYASIWYYY